MKQIWAKLSGGTKQPSLSKISIFLNPLSANPNKWSNTLKQFVGKLRVFEHLLELAFKGLKIQAVSFPTF